MNFTEHKMPLSPKPSGRIGVSPRLKGLTPAAALQGRHDEYPSLRTVLDLQRLAGNKAVTRSIDEEQAGRGRQDDIGPAPKVASVPLYIQRRVNEFHADVEVYDPPATDLVREIDAKDFDENKGTVEKRIRNGLACPLKRAQEVPTSIFANIEAGVDNALPRGKRSANVGLIGRDEFFIKRGLRENFEGGHLIPHALWDRDDHDADEADTYANLVPMSRTMNVMDWADREERYKKKLAEIPQGHSLNVTINLTHESHEVTLARIASLFNLTLAQGVDPGRVITLWGWIPRSTAPSWQHVDTGSEEDMSEVEENPLRSNPIIPNGAALVSHLKSTGTWNSIDINLKNTLEKL